MLEIFFVYWLCKANKRHALARGQKGGRYIALTIILWFVFELLGSFIGLTTGSRFGAYLCALGFAAVGGLISNQIAKTGSAI
jgi:hypothetical protein